MAHRLSDQAASKPRRAAPHKAVLTQLYDAARQYVNYFLPSFKLKSKTRTGATVAKQYLPPATPCDRLLAHAAVPDDVKETLQTVRASLDPVQLLGVIRDAQRDLLELRAASDDCDNIPTTDEFLTAVNQLWRKGQKHRAPYQRHAHPRHWRTRADPFAETWPVLLAWLEKEPDITAKTALDRLLEERPGAFKVGQLRTLQRRFQEWRSEQAEALLRIVAESG